MEFPNIDPIAIDLGFFQIRWYALGYLGGFIGGWALAVRLSQLYPKATRPNAEDIGNLLTWIILGIILGGRLGYVLFYNFDYYLHHLNEVAHLWQGGMSFHGGLLGVLLVIVLYTRFHKISLLRTGDVICAVVPIGLGLGRLSNFVNGELYGRVTDDPWGVVFPHGGDLARHPSQLYQAFLEGVVLLVLLNVLIRVKAVREKPGIVAGAFFVGYGIARIIVEFFREPDAQIGLLFEYFSMGQLLSLPMIFSLWPWVDGLCQTILKLY